MNGCMVVLHMEQSVQDGKTHKIAQGLAQDTHTRCLSKVDTVVTVLWVIR